MEGYVIALISASLVIALISILTPNGAGTAKHVRLLSSLFLVCVLIAPLGGLIGGLRDLANGTLTLPNLSPPNQSDAEAQMQEALDLASKQYFLDSLEQLLMEEFAIKAGELRCAAKWSEANGELLPTRITVVLSGSAIWKDPTKIEQFVTDLLGCECVTAVE